jgi:beta-phosphoglucomutase-like phosphatase (HAD superfamily)
MSKNSIVIGVDLDGVCADFYGRMRQIAAEWFERPIEELSVDVSYGLSEWGITNQSQYDSLHRFAVTHLRQLSDEGFRIRIITHRLFIHYFHAAAVQQTVNWLDSHGIPYWDLCFMKAKTQVGADIYIEDSPDNIEQLRNKGLNTICFGNSTNRHIEAPRAESWQEVYALVTSLRA